MDFITVQKHEITNPRDFSSLAFNVRMWLNDGTRDKQFVREYYSFMSFLLENFPINRAHYGYINQKSGLNPAIDNMTSQVLKEFDATLGDLEKWKYGSFNIEYRMRPIESIFSCESNLIKKSTWWKKSDDCVSQETFDELVDRFWYFVEYARNNGKPLAA